MSEVPDAGPVEGSHTLVSEEDGEVRATLVEHLNELRHRIVRSLLILTVGWVVGWFLQPWLYKELNDMVIRNLRDVMGPEARIDQAFRNAADAFMLKLKLSFMLGLILALPFIVLQIWAFVRPGLKSAERKPIEKMAPLTVVLFALGCFFCWLILPAAIRWFGSFFGEFPDTGLIQEPGAMIFFSLRMMLAFGIGFQLPLIVFALGAMNLLSAEFLTRYWRQASLVIFVLSAVLTPSGDAFSMTMMAVPLVILFLISVWAVKITQRKRSKAASEESGG